jgi:hypothetical protein
LPVLDLLEGVLSLGVPGDEPLLFWLLLMMSLLMGATAMAMRQRRSHCNYRSCVCVCVCVWTCGARAWASFIPCVLFEKVSECQKEVRINE